MLQKTRGIVLRTHKYGETSLIVEMYTEARGVRKYVVNGVRSARAKSKANLLQHMSLLDIVAYERNDRDLNRLKEFQLAYSYESIPFNVFKGAIGLFMTEVSRKAIREEEANEQLFKFLFNAYQLLDKTEEKIGHFHLLFLLELSVYLGFPPSAEGWSEGMVFDLQEGAFKHKIPAHSDYMTGDLALAFRQLLRVSLKTSHQLQTPKVLRLSLLDQLIKYYQLHLDGMGEIYAHQVLKDVF